MKLDRQTGTITAGKRADLILVAGRPDRDISDIRKVKTVIAAGREFNCAELWEECRVPALIVRYRSTVTGRGGRVLPEQCRRLTGKSNGAEILAAEIETNKSVIKDDPARGDESMDLTVLDASTVLSSPRSCNMTSNQDQQPEGVDRRCLVLVPGDPAGLFRLVLVFTCRNLGLDERLALRPGIHWHDDVCFIVPVAGQSRSRGREEPYARGH